MLAQDTFALPVPRISIELGVWHFLVVHRKRKSLFFQFFLIKFLFKAGNGFVLRKRPDWSILLEKAEQRSRSGSTLKDIKNLTEKFGFKLFLKYKVSQGLDKAMCSIPSNFRALLKWVIFFRQLERQQKSAWADYQTIIVCKDCSKPALSNVKMLGRILQFLDKSYLG